LGFSHKRISLYLCSNLINGEDLFFVLRGGLGFQSMIAMSSQKSPLPMTDHPIPQGAFDWYDEYAHGLIDRRTFMNRLGTLASAGFTMGMLLPALMPDYAAAEQVSFNDPGIKASYESFPSPKGHSEGRGYLVKPVPLEGKAPVVLVVHENRGLNPYIKDVARRLAKAGFVAFAPDALHPVGGYPGNDDEGRALQRKLERGKIEQDMIAAARFLKTHPLYSGKLGAVGFCFGGYIVNMLAATLPDTLDAGVPFYGTPAAEEIRPKVKGPLLVQLAELDKRVNAIWPEYEKSLKENKANYTMHLYPRANHGFHNDSTGRYDEKQAELAWKRTVEFFKEHLS
jgi:carboxymethylenebutenolidase